MQQCCGRYATLQRSRKIFPVPFRNQMGAEDLLEQMSSRSASHMELAMNVLNDVTLIISKQVGIPPEQLNSESRLEAIGVESLDVIEIVFALEEKYNIAIPFNANDSAALAFETIGQVADAVQKLVEPRRSA
jgi:acyl carrier protein